MICECSDGSQAVESYAAQPPDWVLMDIEMKGLDGISATRQMKETALTAQRITNHLESRVDLTASGGAGETMPALCEPG